MLAGRDVDDRAQHELAVLDVQRVERDLDRDLVAVTVLAEQLAARAHRVEPRIVEERGPQRGMLAAEPVGHEQLHRPAHQLIPRVAEQLLELRIDQCDLALAVDQDHARGRGLDRQQELLHRAAPLRDVADERRDTQDVAVVDGRERDLDGQLRAVERIAASWHARPGALGAPDAHARPRTRGERCRGLAAMIKSSAIDAPSAASRGYPKVRSAARLRSSITPVASSEMTASNATSRTSDMWISRARSAPAVPRGARTRARCAPPRIAAGRPRAAPRSGGGPRSPAACRYTARGAAAPRRSWSMLAGRNTVA